MGTRPDEDRQAFAPEGEAHSIRRKDDRREDNLERWTLPGGRVGTVDLAQGDEAVEEARRILVDLGATREDAPEAGQGFEGENNPQIKEGTSVNSIQEAADARQGVAETLATVAASPTGFVTLEADDAQFVNLYEPVFVPVSEGEQGTRFVVRVTDRDGTTLPAGTVDYAALAERVGRDWMERFWVTPQLTTSVDDKVVTSCGEWHLDGREDVDGEPHYRYVSGAELRRREKAAREAVQAALEADHPQIVTSKPGWSAQRSVGREPDGEVYVEYVRECGAVTLTREAIVDGDGLRFLDGTTAPDVLVNVERVMTSAELRALAADALAAADAIDADHVAEVSEMVEAVV